MTNFTPRIRKLMLALTGALLLATPALAALPPTFVEDKVVECGPQGSLVQLKKQFEDVKTNDPKAAVIKLDDQLRSNIMDNLGPPPQQLADAEWYLVRTSDIGAIAFIGADGCVIGHIGPAAIQEIKALIGIADAND